MRRKVLLVSVLVLLMLFAAAPLISLPVSAEEPKVETAGVQAPVTIFSEGFESTSWPSQWVRGDEQPLNGIDTWGFYNVGYEGYKSAWCNGYGEHPAGIQYDNYMRAYMDRTVDLSGYVSGSVTLSYRYFLSTEYMRDFLMVRYLLKDHSFYTYVDGRSGVLGGWHLSTVSIPTDAVEVGFFFYSDYSVTNTGAWVDDVKLTGTPIGYSVTIDAVCWTEWKMISVPITKDGSPSGYNTPHTFSLTGTHTFTVPATDAMGHPFYQWSTGSTSTTITVSSGGTYYAHYISLSPSVEIWTDKTTYAKGQTLTAKIQAFNPGPAITVKVNCWFGLPGGGTYMYETFYTGTIPASYTSPVYTWKSFTVPTSAAPGTYSVNAEMRNSATNALIDSDTYTFTIT